MTFGMRISPEITVVDHHSFMTRGIKVEDMIWLRPRLTQWGAVFHTHPKTVTSSRSTACLGFGMTLRIELLAPVGQRHFADPFAPGNLGNR